MYEERLANTRCICRMVIIVAAMICATITVYNVLSIGSQDRIKLAEITSFNPTINPPATEPSFPPSGSRDKDL